jgi:hypothetical protein
MSSTLRKFSQIPVRTKYLLLVSPSVEPESDISNGDLFGTGGVSIVRVTGTSIRGIGPTATVDQITMYATEYGADMIAYATEAGTLFKDMGRQLTVYDSTIDGDLHVATYRECQSVAGSASEGVIENTLYGANYWIRVWAADGSNVVVARTG